MSPDDRLRMTMAEALIVIVAMIVATVWYAVPQLAYSVYPLIDLARGLLP